MWARTSCSRACACAWVSFCPGSQNRKILESRLVQGFCWCRLGPRLMPGPDRSPGTLQLKANGHPPQLFCCSVFTCTGIATGVPQQGTRHFAITQLQFSDHLPGYPCCSAFTCAGIARGVPQQGTCIDYYSTSVNQSMQRQSTLIINSMTTICCSHLHRHCHRGAPARHTS